MKEKSRLISQDGASQDHIRNIESKLDQEKLGRQRAETQVYILCNNCLEDRYDLIKFALSIDFFKTKDEPKNTDLKIIELID